MKALALLLAIVSALAVLIIPTTLLTAAPPVPGVQEEFIVTNNDAHKWPSLAVGFGQVHLTWSTPGRANYGARGEEAHTLFRIENLGSVGSNSTYFNTAVALGRDGTIHYAWINEGGTIYHVSKAPDALNWSGAHVVAARQNFANTLNMTVRGNTEVFIAWRHQGGAEGSIGFAYSNTGGVTWPIITDAPTPTGVYAGRPDLAAAPNNGPVFLTWTGTDGNVYIGDWNGQNFSTSCVSCARYGPGNDFFNPSVAAAPDGRPFVAWRSVGRGVFYGSRTNGQWGLSNQFPADAYPEVSSVGIGVDSRSNVHLTWLSKGGDGAIHTFYAVQKPNDAFSNPIIVSRDSGAYKANLDLAVCAHTTYTQAHIAYESFGGGQYIRYARVRANDVGSIAGAMPEMQPQDEAKRTAIYRNPHYLPMITKQLPTPTPTPTPIPPPPSPTC